MLKYNYLFLCLVFLSLSSQAQYGAVNRKGKVVIPYEYEAIKTFVDGEAWAKKNGKYGLINSKGQTIIPFEYENVYGFNRQDYGFNQGVKAVQKNGLYGFINRNNETVIPFKYDAAGKFKDSLTWVSKDGIYGCIDLNGNTVLPFQYPAEQMPIFNEDGFAQVGSYNYFALIDMQGDTILPMGHFPNGTYGYKLGHYSEGLAYIRKKGKVGYINKQYEMVIAPEFEFGYMFKEGLAVVKKEGKQFYIDKKGKPVLENLPYDEIGDFSDGIAQVKRNNKVGYINKQGKEVIPCIYKVAKKISYYREANQEDVEGLIWVTMGQGKTGFIDSKNNTIVSLEYESVNWYSNGLASFKKNGKYGFVDRSGQVIIPAKFDYAYSFRDKNHTLVQMGELWGIINRKGDLVIPCEYERNPDLRIADGLLWMYKFGKMGCLNLKNELIIPFIFNYSGGFNEYGISIGRIEDQLLLKKL